MDINALVEFEQQYGKKLELGLLVELVPEHRSSLTWPDLYQVRGIHWDDICQEIEVFLLDDDVRLEQRAWSVSDIRPATCRVDSSELDAFERAYGKPLAVGMMVRIGDIGQDVLPTEGVEVKQIAWDSVRGFMSVTLFDCERRVEITGWRPAQLEPTK